MNSPSPTTSARPWRFAEVEPTRLARAFELRVDDVLDTGIYAVHSPQSGERHYVNLADPDCPACDCGDHVFRERLCAHALAAMLYEEDQRLLYLVGRLVRRAWLDARLIFAITAQPIGRPIAPATADAATPSPDGAGA